MLHQVRDTDIHLLRVFVAVAESGGFAAAQDRLNVAASTISTQISNLETRLGFRLCKRGRSGFSLTNQGEIVLTSTYKLLRNLGDFVSELEATKDDLVGTVRIAFLDNILTHPDCRLASAFKDIRTNYPFLQFDLRQMSPTRVESSLLKREADVAVSWFSSRTPSLSFEPIFNENHLVYCATGHPLFSKGDSGLSPSDLEKVDWVKRAYLIPQTIHFSDPPITTAEAHYMEGTALFILSGTHVGYLPEHYAQRWVDAGIMRPILPEKVNYEATLHLATREDMSNDRRVEAVRQAVIAAHRPQNDDQDSGNPIA